MMRRIGQAKATGTEPLISFTAALG